MADEPLIAVFIDFENLALGVKEAERSDFRMDLVLKRFLEKGRIVFKRAYCDWSRFRGVTRLFHAQSIQMLDIPQNKLSGKNSADIHMVVDALDLAYAKDHIDIFALVTGDSDFSPLVSKLKENNKRVIGCGVKNSTSHLLIDSCDEFIYYDDLVRSAQNEPLPQRLHRHRALPVAFAAGGEGTAEAGLASAPKKRAPGRRVSTDHRAAKEASATQGGAAGPGVATPQAAPNADMPVEAEPDSVAAASSNRRSDFDVNPARQYEGITKLVQIVRSLSRDYDTVWGSMIKQTIRRVYPGFNEEYFGYASFAALLEDAAARDYLDLEFDEARGNYMVRLQPE